MIVTIVPFVMLIVGVLMFALCANPKLAKVGEWMMAAGFFAIAFTYAGHGVILGPR